MSKEKYTGPRVQRRLHWLKVLVAAGGGPTSVGAAVGTPPSHISAMTAGRRGVGDALADSLENAFGRPNGWMDMPIPGVEAPLANESSHVAPPTLAQALEVVITAITALPQPKRKTLAEDLALLAVAPGDAETRQRVATALQTGPSITEKLLAVPSQVESPRLPQRATEK